MSSVHTKSAHATMLRLQQLGVSARDLLESITLIIAQRLLRRLCPHCRQSSITVCDAAALAPSRPHVCYTANPQGCGQCSGGYWGRIGIFELAQTEHLDMRSATAKSDGAPKNAGGLNALRERAVERHLLGDTSWEEVNRIVPAELSNCQV